MAKAYFGSRISANMITTPEGYLVCKNVPIARTGHQEYLGSEFGGPQPEARYDITRSEQEVFDRAAIASFEGKPVVDEHPEEDVTAENFAQYMKGVCREVRRGEGEYQNCLIGDLVIYDKDLINKIQNGKREVSCGYDCLWCQTGDRSFEQREIRGNHIAIVDRGRAGHKVAIRDSAERSITMNPKELMKRMFSAFVKDGATPEEIVGASQFLNDAAPTPAPAPAPAPAPEPKPAIDAELDARLKRIEDALAGLAKPAPAPTPAPAPAPKPEPDALDALEQELQGCPVDDEDDLVEDPEVINQQAGDACGDEECPPAPEDPAPISAVSRDNALKIIQNLRPLVASMPLAQRKKTSDSLALIIRGQVAKDSGYMELQEVQRKNAGARDSKPFDAKDYGRQIRNKYNPHYNANKED